MNFGALLFGIAVFLLIGAAGAAAPRVIVEAEVEPAAAVWVNMQTGFKVRLLHAVDVSAAEFPPPSAPRAEIVAIGSPVVGETVRNGLRYRSHEQQFSLTPFASGPMSIRASVRGKSAGGLPETNGNSRWELTATPIVIDVRPAEGSAQWLPARALRVFSTPTSLPELPPGEHISVLWTIEAEGVAPSLLPDPLWEANGLVVHAEPAVRSSRGIRKGKDWVTVATRQQRVNYLPTQTGDFTIPPTSITWWNTQNGRETVAISEPLVLRVRPRLGSDLAQPDSVPIGPNVPPGVVWYSGALGLLVLILLWQPVAILMAVIGNRPRQARRRLRSMTGGEIPQALRRAHATLDAHCFGPSATAWRSACISALPALCRHALLDRAWRSGITLLEPVFRWRGLGKPHSIRPPATQGKDRLPLHPPARYRKPLGR